MSRRGARRGGLRFGALTGLFYGAQLLSSTARNRRDMGDTIYAALATGAVMGALSGAHAASEPPYLTLAWPCKMGAKLPAVVCAVPGPAVVRLRSGVLGAALGGVVRRLLAPAQLLGA